MIKSYAAYSLLAILALFFMVGCSGAPTEPEARVPELRVNVTSLSFSDNQTEATLIISNAGGGTLNWTITGKPDWLALTKQNGIVTDKPDSIEASVDLTLSNGDYSGQLVIASGTDTATIAVNYLVRNKPELAVAPSSLNFSDEQTEASLIVSNTGGGELSWMMIDMPDWLEFSKLQGAVTNLPDTVHIIADTKRQNGEYSGRLSIHSNAGNALVEVALRVEHGVDVFPGQGAAGVNLGDSFSEIVTHHGTPERESLVLAIINGRAIWFHFKFYDTKGLTFVLLAASPNLQESDGTELIALDQPYRGLTEAGVGIGTLLEEVISAYGPPERIDREFNEYEYPSIGINFGFEETETIVENMVVVRPSSGSNRTNQATLLMEQFRLHKTK